METSTTRLLGQVDKIFEHSGRGVILGLRGGAAYIMQFFIHEAPSNLKVGEWVSFVPGLYKAIDIRRETGIMNNVIPVNFKEKRRVI